MFKKAAQQVRIITEHFACVGLGTGQVGAVWVVSAGVQMPPALEQNSEEDAGVIPPMPSGSMKQDSRRTSGTTRHARSL